MASKTWIPGAIATAALMALLSAPAHAQRASVVVQIAPPAPQVEVVPAVPRGQVWVPGHWRWNGSQHVWVPGRMSARRSGYIYMPAQWVSVNGRWEYREGTWVRPGRSYRDSDGDGIADRMDRDKDGDGVRNAQDARPNNPNVGGGPVYVQVPPPPPRVEPPPVARRGQVWVPGHWRWNGREHVWIEGRYTARRSGYVWAPSAWVQIGGRWEYREGRWTRPGNSCRDSDNDGVCDRFDRDRDGDGTRNSQDNRPNNPNR